MCIRDLSAPSSRKPRASGRHLLLSGSLLPAALLVACQSADVAPTPEPTPAAMLACYDASSPPSSLTDFETRFDCEIYPLLSRSNSGCASCHSSSSDRLMRLDVDGPSSFRRLRNEGFLEPDQANTLLDRVTRTDTLSMPLGGPPWTTGEQALLGNFVADLAAFVCTLPVDPGRVTLHRHNRAEYNNTMRDLLNDQTRPADGFPVDDRGYGYDNIADVLSMSPLLVEKYDGAAELLVQNALGTRLDAASQRWEAEQLEGSSGSATEVGWKFSSNGAVSMVAELEHSGDYSLSARAYGEQAGDEPARMTFSVDGVEVARFDVTAVEQAPATYSSQLSLEPGTHTLMVAFINDYWNPLGPPGNKDRNLVVDWIGLDGPLNSPDPTGTARDQVLTCTPVTGQETTCAREILAAFGRRAWRRPLDQSELDRLVSLVSLALSEGDHFEEGIKLGMHALLLSPNFLFRVEFDPDPGSSDPHPVDDFALAARLSYFLWSSTPDEELLELAETRRLNDPDELSRQVTRMLLDVRSDALVDNFAGQWLYTRSMDTVSPEPTLFPDFDDALRQSMAMETRLFFQRFLREDRSMLDMLDADFTFLNARLAEHYGIEGDFGEDFVEVVLPPTQRGGLLTQGSFHTVTSYPDRTSPVTRGKWVLEQLLCQPPAPPPAGVVGVEAEDAEDISQRDAMELHRSDPTCASCHAMMDPIGFSLENYDGISAWRDVDDNGFPIDATGELPDGRTFDGPFELSALLKEDPAVPRCITQHLFIYALGRGPDVDDRCTLDALTRSFTGDGHRLTGLIEHLVLSDAFRFRRGEDEATAATREAAQTSALAPAGSGAETSTQELASQQKGAK